MFCDEYQYYIDIRGDVLRSRSTQLETATAITKYSEEDILREIQNKSKLENRRLGLTESLHEE